MRYLGSPNWSSYCNEFQTGRKTSKLKLRTLLFGSASWICQKCIHICWHCIPKRSSHCITQWIPKCKEDIRSETGKSVLMKTFLFCSAFWVCWICILTSRMWEEILLHMLVSKTQNSTRSLKRKSFEFVSTVLFGWIAGSVHLWC